MPKLDQPSSCPIDERFPGGRRSSRGISNRDLAPVRQGGPLLKEYRRCLELGRRRCLRHHRRCDC